MREPIVAREEVARNLAVSRRRLAIYETNGLIRASRQGDVEGYAPGEIRRIWAIVSYQRDLGMNLAGVEVVLKLRDQLEDVHRKLDKVASQVREVYAENSASRDDA
jgi:MerR family transcriptional regulator/heat shock protein HspR